MSMLTIPANFPRCSLQFRLRYLADQFDDRPGSRRLADTLREAADELDLVEQVGGRDGSSGGPWI